MLCENWIKILAGKNENPEASNGLCKNFCLYIEKLLANFVSISPFFGLVRNVCQGFLFFWHAVTHYNRNVIELT